MENDFVQPVNQLKTNKRGINLKIIRNFFVASEKMRNLIK